MKIITLKKIPGREWKVGTNVECTPQFGARLISQGLAGEIPEKQGKKWILGGEESKEKELHRADPEKFPISVEQFKHNKSRKKSKK